MKRTMFVLMYIAALGTGVADARQPRVGLIYEDLGKTAPEHRMTSVPVGAGAKSFRSQTRVDLSDEIPPIGFQGQSGSCVCWAVAYYHRSQLEYRERHWDLADHNHQFSPAFVYNQINGGADNGSGWSNVFPLICEQGCASLADCPYNAGDCTSWPSESAYSHAIPFRCTNWSWFYMRDTSELNQAKQMLCNGSTVVFGIGTYANFDSIGKFNNIYCVADSCGTNQGGHGVCIVGYDDTLPTHDGPGAFRLANSWGTSWGDSGFFWMSYVAALDSFFGGQGGLFLSDTTGYEPELLGRVRIEHGTRDRVAIKFSVGSLNAPLWRKQFRTYPIVVTDERPFPANNMVFDLTEAASYIESQQTDSIYFITWDSWSDSVDGTLRCFSAQYLPWGNAYASIDTPVDIPDDGTNVHAGARVLHHDHDVTPALLFSPSHIVEPESSCVPKVAVYNYGSQAASFLVRLAISDGYRDSAQVTNLAATESVNISFRPWIAPLRGDYTLRCSTGLAGDEYTQNDTLVGQVRVRLHDVAALEILAPSDTVDSGVGISPKVTVRNNGTQSETFIARFRIPDEGYNRPAQVTLLAESSGAVRFPTWMPRVPGYHTFSCTLALAGDQYDTNDIIWGGVVVGMAEGASVSPARFVIQTVVRGLLALPVTPRHKQQAANWLMDATGGKVLALRPGANDVRALAPGVYFVYAPGSEQSTVTCRKVVVTR